MRLETARLVLREWRETDKSAYAAIIGDPVVRRYFPNVGSYADAVIGIERARQRLAELGYGFLAVERRSDGAFMGMLGIGRFRDEIRRAIPGEPEVEIGWQLGRAFWGQGYAPEGAAAMLDFAWTTARLPEIVAITYEGNLPSRRVMEKLGMQHDPAASFAHPDIPPGHPLQAHVLYRLANPLL